MNTHKITFLTFAVIATCHLHGADAVISGTTPVPVVEEIAERGYKLAWSDEFDGQKLDETKWDYRIDSKMWSTQLPANVTVADGCLKVALKKEEAGTKHYTGGGVISKQKFGHGYYEARFRVPPGGGWHTSFWGMNYDGKDTKGMGAQEIDFCEQDSVGLKKYSAGVLAWDQHGKGYGRKYVKTPDLSADFHVWGCEFTPEVVNFYFDGVLTHSTEAVKFKHAPQCLWLTVIACNLGNTYSVDNSKLPSVAEFDYMRFYTLPDSASPAAATPAAKN